MSPFTGCISRMKDSAIPFFFSPARGLSSVVVLRLYTHSTSRNPVPVAAPQRARVVYARLPCQSLHSDDRHLADYRVVFHSSKQRSTFVVADPSKFDASESPDRTIAVSYRSGSVVNDGKLIPPCYCRCERLHAYRGWFVIAVHLGAGSTFPTML